MDYNNLSASDLKLETPQIKVEDLEIDDNHVIEEASFQVYIKEEIETEEKFGLGISKYECNICDQIFTDEFSLKQHVKESHHNYCHEKPVPSTSSTKRQNLVEFCSNSGLSEQQTQNCETAFTCELTGCLKSFKTKGQLNRHIQMHSEGKPFKCSYKGCSKSFKVLYYLKRHLIFHNNDKPYKCNFSGCEREFKKKYGLLCHQLTHPFTSVGNEIIACEYPDCNITFPMKNANYYKHMKRHKSGYRHRCEFQNCNASFKRRDILEEHMQVHMGDGPSCSSKNYNSREYTQRRENKNTKISPKQESEEVVLGNIQRNSIASKKFKEKNNTVQQEYMELFACEYPDCKKTFQTIYEFESHCNYHDTKITAFKCEFPGCLKVFKRKNILKDHMIVHYDEKPFGCSVDGCKKVFKCRKHLKAHLVRHSEESFRCTHEGCDKTFKLECYLKRHLSNHHLDSDNPRPILCDFPECSSTFRMKNITYYKHMQKHKFGRRYRCTVDQCEAAYHENRDLKRHMETHLRERLFCDYPGCQRSYSHIYRLISHKETHHDVGDDSGAKKNCTKTSENSELLRDHLEGHKQMEKSTHKGISPKHEPQTSDDLSFKFEFEGVDQFKTEDVTDVDVKIEK